MDTQFSAPLRATVLGLLLCTATYAQAEMYRWIDAEGTVTFSNTPPSEPARVKELTRIEDTTAPKGTARTLPQQAQPRYLMGKPEMLPGEPGASERQPATTVQRDAENMPRATRGAQTEAVRDPCLRSSDPKCYERNKDRYHPYLGYSSTPVQPAPPAIGATNSTGAGGSIGGAIIIRR